MPLALAIPCDEGEPRQSSPSAETDASRPQWTKNSGTDMADSVLDRLEQGGRRKVCDEMLRSCHAVQADLTTEEG
jgi:hypothetical protein